MSPPSAIHLYPQRLQKHVVAACIDEADVGLNRALFALGEVGTRVQGFGAVPLQHQIAAVEQHGKLRRTNRSAQLALAFQRSSVFNAESRQAWRIDSPFQPVARQAEI